MCCKCKQSKSVSEYHLNKSTKDGFHKLCKPCRKIEHSQRYYSNHTFELERCAKYRSANQPAINERHRERRHDPSKRVAVLAWEAEYRERPDRRLSSTLRSRLWHAMQSGQRDKHTMEYLGCNIEVFREWIEFQFYTGVDWKSGFDIDHVLPCAAFDLCNSAQAGICFHWTNMQPLTQSNNLTKGRKVCVRQHSLVQERAMRFIALHPELFRSGYEALCESTKWLRIELRNRNNPRSVM